MDKFGRQKELTDLKTLANSFLDFYTTERAKNPGGWKIRVIQRNTAILKRIISQVNENLKTASLEEFIAAYPMPELGDMNELYSKFSTILSQRIDLHELTRCSPRISYYNDFTWFHHGVVREHIEYALGKTDESVFNKYLPFQIERIETWKNTFFNNPYFNEDRQLVTSILRLVQSSELVSANILIITLIEGIGRKFCRLVYARQYPDLSENEIEESIYSVPKSFDDLIRNTKWLPDIPVGFAELLTAYTHSDDDMIYQMERKVDKAREAERSIKRKIGEIQEKIRSNDNPNEDMVLHQEIKESLDKLTPLGGSLLSEKERIAHISIKLYLDFLVRKLKDDRNNIIHGKYSLFNENWITLLYLTALEELLKRIVNYERKAGSLGIGVLLTPRD